MNKNELHNERELLLRVAEGDEVAFRKLINHYQPLLYTIALRLIDEKWIAEEIVQDAFLRVWLKRSSLSSIENFGGWIFKIATNLTLNAIKRVKKETNGTIVTLESSFKDYDLASNNITKEEVAYLELLEEAIKNLSPKQREAYDLIKGQRLSRIETAGMMNVSPETVKYHIEMALRNIRAYCIARLDKTSALVIFYLIYKN